MIIIPTQPTSAFVLPSSNAAPPNNNPSNGTVIALLDPQLYGALSSCQFDHPINDQPLPPGPDVFVALSNGSIVACPRQWIIRTAAFGPYGNGGVDHLNTLYSSCPYFDNGVCQLGASCAFVHVLRQPEAGSSLTPVVPMPAHPLLNPTVAPTAAQPMPTWPAYQVRSSTCDFVPTCTSGPVDVTLDVTTANYSRAANADLYRNLGAGDASMKSLRFSKSRQRRGNKPIAIPAPAAGDSELGPRQLIVNYLAPRVDTAGLRQLFSVYGDLEDALVVLDAKRNQSRGFGFLVFRRAADAAAAVESATGRVLLGKRIRVAYLSPQFPANRGLTLADIAAQLDPLLSDQTAGCCADECYSQIESDTES